ncbi:MAG TPA: S9 family peptidase [Steroidobacteraceae bacterium]|nr:S9 family peptidase [Steroidobacteraceae bacterium]
MTRGLWMVRVGVCCSLGVLAALAWTPPAEAQKRTITHEDVWLMKRVGAPVPSPDGKWVIVSVTEPAYDADDQSSELWIVPAKGGVPPRRLTASPARENGVTWSRDSRRIAFSSKREGDEVEQIYVLDIADGGEAIPVTDLSTGARSPQFSPDGSRILFVSTVYRGAMNDEDNKRLAEERKARKYHVRAYEGFPIRHWDKWIDPERQSHVFVQPVDDPKAARNLLAGTELTRGPGFSGRWTDSGEEIDAVWAPDGRSIVFVASTNWNTRAYDFATTDLFSVDANGGQPVRLTQGRDSWSQPGFSADGSKLYALLEPESRFTYTAERLAALDWPKVGAARVLTERFDRAITSYGVPRSGTRAYVLAEDAGHENLYSLARSGGNVEPLGDAPSGAYSNLRVPLTASMPQIFANWESATSPGEVVRVDPETGRRVFLTSFNQARAAQIDWQPVRHFWFESTGGRRIHNMLVLPPEFDESKRYPLFVVIHGGPHSMWRDQFVLRWNYHLLASPGYVVLLTNYTGSTGFGEQFARNIQGDPLKTPGEEINQAADEAIKRFAFIDASRQCAGGASYGGHLSNWLQATTTRYRCLVSHAGLVSLQSQWGTSDTVYQREIMNGGPPWEQGAIWQTQSPIRYANQFKTPTLVTVGESDFRVPLNNALEYWTVLQRQQVTSRLIVFPDENHWILKGEDSRYFYHEVHAWLARWLKES